MTKSNRKPLYKKQKRFLKKNSGLFCKNLLPILDIVLSFYNPTYKTVYIFVIFRPFWANRVLAPKCVNWEGETFFHFLLDRRESFSYYVYMKNIKLTNSSLFEGFKTLEETFFRPTNFTYTNWLSNWVDGFEVKVTDSSYVYTLQLPGYKKDNVEVELKDNVLVCRATNNNGTIFQSVQVSDCANKAKIEAKLEDGLLNVIFDKLPNSKPLKISLK